eukprot:TRINITY_DN3194_c0_g2_i1.p1 TRINITY_DN3194_c0_g2~~TRINITY_DN3194_c0_g2_i1.p1  ORF type:complete len:313 (+),score=53.49 TRINITY_DN3194_c0_g2_i1:151-1089(+)
MLESKEHQEDPKWFFSVHLPNELGLKTKEDWYQVTRTDIVNHGGKEILDTTYGGLIRNALQTVFPDHKWMLWRFDGPVPKGMWDDIRFKRDFMDYLSKELHIEKMEDWYSVTAAQIREKGGAGLLRLRYEDSPSKMITSIFKEHQWNLSEFGKRRGIWDHQQSHKDFLDHLAQKLKVTKMEDWYNIHYIQIRKNGGAGLLRRYQNSPSKMITSILTYHKWNLAHFTHKPIRVWNIMQFQEDLIHRLQKELNIVHMEDWYRVTKEQICEKGGQSLLKRYQNSPSKMVTSIFRNHQWDPEKFNQIRKPKLVSRR